MVDFQFIESNLSAVLTAIRNQRAIADSLWNSREFDDEVTQTQEWLDVGEYGLAYESLVGMLEHFAFNLPGPVAIRLLEVGLLFKFKSERTKDSAFDSRRDKQ